MNDILLPRSTKFLLCFILLAFLWCSVSSCDSGKAPNSTKVPIGKEGLLSGTSGTITPVGTSETALQQFLKSHRAKDKHGIVQMMASGSVFMVDNGTKVLVIDYGESLGMRKIRILEGTREGRAGYVPYEWVKPL
jgi:hypothetical protein